MDHRDVWHELEMAPRVNLTMTCKQIYQETEQIFHANNTFLFQARDNRKNYGVLESLAEWLHYLNPTQRETVGKIVICSKQQQGMVNWAWVCAGYCDMDSGFVVGKRIDRKMVAKTEDGEIVDKGYESWGREDGHFCNKSHYLLVPKKQAKRQAKKGQKKEVQAKIVEK